MEKLFRAILISSIIFMANTISVNASENTIQNLIDKSVELDKQEVVIEAEAVGERMIRGSHSWINVNDSTNSMGVWLDDKNADKIRNFGSYSHQGDIVRIKGIFNRSCKEHGGDMDLHSIEVEVIKEGKENVIKVESKKKNLAIGLTFGTLILVGVYYERFKRKIS